MYIKGPIHMRNTPLYEHKQLLWLLAGKCKKQECS